MSEVSPSLESRRIELLSSFENALKNKDPINVFSESKEKFLGDTIIDVCTTHAVLSEYARRNGLPDPILISKPNDGTRNILHTDDIIDISSSRVDFERIKSATETRAKVLATFFQLDGLPTPSFSKLPRVEGSKWLGDFDREKTEEHKKSIKEKVGDRTAIFAQTGGDESKRWSAEQVISAYESTNNKLQNVFSQKGIKPMIISDARLKNDGESEAKLRAYSDKAGVPLYFYESVEELAALTSTGVLFFSTDSSPMWVWKAEREVDEKKAMGFIHHSTTDEVWYLGGSQAHYSDAVRNSNVDPSGFLVGKSKAYFDYYKVPQNERTHVVTTDFEQYLLGVETTINNQYFLRWLSK